MTPEFENYHERIPETDWPVVGQFLLLGMQQVASEFGGVELSIRVAEAAKSDTPLPNPAALTMLEEIQPGMAKRALDAAQEIAEQGMQMEREMARNPGFLKIVDSYIRGAGSIIDPKTYRPR